MEDNVSDASDEVEGTIWGWVAGVGVGSVTAGGVAEVVVVVNGGVTCGVGRLTGLSVGTVVVVEAGAAGFSIGAIVLTTWRSRSRRARRVAFVLTTAIPKERFVGNNTASSQSSIILEMMTKP
jgi:hypothetical protein